MNKTTVLSLMIFFLLFLSWPNHITAHDWETGFYYYTAQFSERQRIHFCFPNKAKRTGHNPLAVFVPGGAWNTHPMDWGDELSIASQKLLINGFIIAYIDFRPTGDGYYWPAQAEDWEAAMAFLYNSSDFLGINTDIVFGWGHSAGGHAINYLRDHGWLSVAVVQSGPSDLTLLPHFWEGLFGPGYSYEQYYQKAWDASPVNMTPTAPPVTNTLILHGSHDEVVPISQGEIMEQKLIDQGHNVSFVKVQNANHVFVPYNNNIWTNYSWDEIDEMTADYILDQLKKFRASKIKQAVIVSDKTILNRSMLNTEYCREIVFENHPDNLAKDIEIIAYKVYRKALNDADYSYITTLNATDRTFLDRHLAKERVDLFSYRVTTIVQFDGNEIESPLEAYPNQYVTYPDQNDTGKTIHNLRN